MMLKKISSHQISGELAMAASQCAAMKNGSYNHNGYTPSQWVLGDCRMT